MTVLLTVGHGTADRITLAPLLRGAGVRQLVDVRTAPGSRRHPDVNRSSLERWVPAAGIDYRWEPALGGFRKPSADPLDRDRDAYWENESFRNYASYTRTPAFLAAIDELLAQVAVTRTAIMCSESVWWRCHRRIISDFATLARGVRVLHLGHDGRLSEHRPCEGARQREDGLLVFDLMTTPALI